jgi:hypothetical protein
VLCQGSSPLEHSYFYAGSPRQNHLLYEYRETPKIEDTIFPEALSTPDKLNGVEWRGSARWYAGAYRTWEDGGTGWSEWKGMRKEDIDPAQVLESLGGNPRRPAWENDRRLKINDNGVYGDEYRCKEISNFRRFACEPPLN